MLKKHDLVKLLSISGHYRGFPYLLDCVNLAAADEDLLSPISRKLYPLVALRHGTTADRVAYNLRNLIGVWWKYGNRGFAPEYLESDARLPGNKAFIESLIAHVQRIEETEN